MYQRVLIFIFSLLLHQSAFAESMERIAILLKYSLPTRMIHHELIKQGEIKSPANTVQWLIKFQALDLDYCLLYRVPFAKQNLSGQLYLHQLVADMECPNTVSANTSAIELHELKLEYIVGQFLRIDYIDNKKQKQKITIDFLDSLNSRIIFNPNQQKSVTITDGESCLEFDSQCNIKTDRCHLCRNGYSLVAGGECIKQYNRRCGIAANNEYAHLRGKSYIAPSSSRPIVLGCHMNSIEGYCADQKHMLCFDGVLRCQ